MTARIHNWSLIEGGHGLALLGRINEHPRQDEFLLDYQITTPIVDPLDPTTLQEGDTCTTASGTVYTLGRPAPSLNLED